MLSDTSAIVVPNPKQNGATCRSRSKWYHYYAGFCPQFVRAMLRQAVGRGNQIVLDPWNGAGTTTRISYELGHVSKGFDINPVMVIVAKARLLSPSQRADAGSTLTDIAAHAHSYRATKGFSRDPLASWLKTDGVIAIRRLERAVFDATGHVRQSADTLTALSAFFHVAIFRVLRTSLAKFRASNPTWLKVPRDGRSKVTLSTKEVVTSFQREVLSMLEEMKDEDEAEAVRACSDATQLATASSCHLPIDSGTADVVLTSPPYCTRIDYAVTTSIELALLGLDRRVDLRCLRDQMTGTSTVRARQVSPDTRWGATCNKFLKKVSTHPSKASETYYLKTHIQYFHDIYRSMMEIERCLRPSGQAIFVVQDSFYKEIRNDLPTIFCEMASSLGWDAILRRDFPVRRSMALVNGRVGKYRQRVDAVESVLWFKKSE